MAHVDFAGLFTTDFFFDCLELTDGMAYLKCARPTSGDSFDATEAVRMPDMRIIIKEKGLSEPNRD